MILGVQIIGIIFCLIVIYLTYMHYKRNEFNALELGLWLVLWLGFGFAILFPDLESVFLKPLHIVRVMDLLTIAGFLVLFTLVFFMYGLVKNNNKRVEEIVRDKALKGLK